MRTSPLLVAFALLAGLLLPPAARSDTPSQDSLVAVGEGMAPLGADPTAAEEEAVWDAKRNAVEQAAGVLVQSRTLGHDQSIYDDVIRSRASGFVRSWEIVPGSKHVEKVGSSEILRLQVRATVALLPVIRSLSDIADVYKDLERPRVRIEVEEDDPQRRVMNAIVAAFRKQGFEVVGGDTAEVVLTGHLWVHSGMKLGDSSSPYGAAAAVAAGQARLSVKLESTASQEMLLATEVRGHGHSFRSDEEAETAAEADAGRRLLNDKDSLFVQQLLVRWARERQEGHVIALRIRGLSDHKRRILHDALMDMRGFRDLLSDSSEGGVPTIRFLTLLDTASVRRRINEMRPGGARLSVTNDRGPIVDVEAGG